MQSLSPWFQKNTWPFISQATGFPSIWGWLAGQWIVCWSWIMLCSQLSTRCEYSKVGAVLMSTATCDTINKTGPFSVIYGNNANNVFVIWKDDRIIANWAVQGKPYWTDPEPVCLNSSVQYKGPTILYCSKLTPNHTKPCQTSWIILIRGGLGWFIGWGLSVHLTKSYRSSMICSISNRIGLILK